MSNLPIANDLKGHYMDFNETGLFYIISCLKSKTFSLINPELDNSTKKKRFYKTAWDLWNHSLFLDNPHPIKNKTKNKKNKTKMQKCLTLKMFQMAKYYNINKSSINWTILYWINSLKREWETSAPFSKILFKSWLILHLISLCELVVLVQFYKSQINKAEVGFWFGRVENGYNYFLVSEWAQLISKFIKGLTWIILHNKTFKAQFEICHNFTLLSK